jgi:hypothetical protein
VRASLRRTSCSTTEVRGGPPVRGGASRFVASWSLQSDAPQANAKTTIIVHSQRLLRIIVLWVSRFR